VPGISGIEEITPPRDRPSRLNIRRIEPAGENAEPSRFELKNDFLVPLHFSCTSNLTGSERNAALLGIRDALVASGQDRRIVVTNPAVLEQNPHLTADAHIQAALRRQPIDRDLGFGKQVDLQGVLNALHQTETQRPPQWNIMVVDHDLTAPVGNGEYLNFAFGVTVPTEHVSVQSVTRLMEAIPPGELRDAAIRRVLRHETGHLFGLPSYRRESNPRGNVEENLGLHCTNPCTMRQGLSVPAWVNLTVQEHNAGIHFCSDCQNDLARVRDTYKPLPRR
jgi:predicted Zn-dependent protease